MASLKEKKTEKSIDEVEKSTAALKLLEERGIKKLTIRIPENKYNQLNQLCSVMGNTINGAVSVAITKYISENKHLID